MTPTLLYALLSGIAIALCALIGVAVVSREIEKRTKQSIRLLTSFSSGVFLVIVILLLREVAETAAESPFGVVAIAAGVLFMLILSEIPEFHHHHTEDGDHDHSHESARRILTSDALHNIGDGVLVAAAFAGGFELGVFTALAIGLHEIIQQLSQFFVLRDRGYTARRALTVNFLVSLTIFIGIGLGFALSETYDIEPVLLGLAAGTLLVVVFHDLLPQSFRALNKDRAFVRHTLAFLAGAGLMIGVSLSAPHGHQDESLEHNEAEIHLGSI